MSNKNTIKVNNLKKYFKSVKAVDGISFTVKKGEIVGFLGSNGAGKSTTIRCLMNFISPTEGNIEVFGLDATKNSEKIKEMTGFLPGEVNLHEEWTGEEHIQLVKNIRKTQTNEDELIQKLDFDPKKKVKNLSTGNKQKLGLILTLMDKPKLLILDEPTTGLDPFLQGEVYKILQDLAGQGTTIFMSSHFLTEVERTCSKVIILKEGKIVAEEDIKDLKKKKLYSVELTFDKKVPIKELKKQGFNVTMLHDKQAELSVSGDIRKIIGKLDDFDITDLEISRSDLEDVLMTYYD
jgi:ABC-2 type transport system ATP-binding protein